MRAVVTIADHPPQRSDFANGPVLSTKEIRQCSVASRCSTCAIIAMTPAMRVRPQRKASGHPIITSISTKPRCSPRPASTRIAELPSPQCPFLGEA